MAKARPTTAPPLTPEQVQIARDEVTAFYDEVLMYTTDALTDTRAVLRGAEEDYAAARTAEITWRDNGTITAPTVAAQKLVEIGAGSVALAIEASAAVRAIDLAQTVDTALYGDFDGSGRRPVSAEEREAVDTALDRVLIVRQWLAANTG